MRNRFKEQFVLLFLYLVYVTKTETSVSKVRVTTVQPHWIMSLK